MIIEMVVPWWITYSGNVFLFVVLWSSMIVISLAVDQLADSKQAN